MNRRKPNLTSALCVHITCKQRALLERYADKEKISLGEASRELMDLGAKSLGLLDLIGEAL